MVFEEAKPCNFYGNALPRPFIVMKDRDVVKDNKKRKHAQPKQPMVEGRCAFGTESGREGGVLRNNEVLLGAC